MLCCSSTLVLHSFISSSQVYQGFTDDRKEFKTIIAPKDGRKGPGFKEALSKENAFHGSFNEYEGNGKNWRNGGAGTAGKGGSKAGKSDAGKGGKFAGKAVGKKGKK